MLQVHGNKRIQELTYPMQLDLTRFSAQHAFMQGWSWGYRLGMGILHNGFTGANGHYTMFHRSQDNSWVIRDDRVSYPVANPLAFKKEIVGLVYYK